MLDDQPVSMVSLRGLAVQYAVTRESRKMDRGGRSKSAHAGNSNPGTGIVSSSCCASAIGFARGRIECDRRLLCLRGLQESAVRRHEGEHWAPSALIARIRLLPAFRGECDGRQPNSRWTGSPGVRAGEPDRPVVLAMRPELELRHGRYPHLYGGGALRSLIDDHAHRGSFRTMGGSVGGHQIAALTVCCRSG